MTHRDSLTYQRLNNAALGLRGLSGAVVVTAVASGAVLDIRIRIRRRADTGGISGLHVDARVGVDVSRGRSCQGGNGEEEGGEDGGSLHFGSERL